MENRCLIYFAIGFCSLLFATGCAVTKHVPAGDFLYLGAEIEAPGDTLNDSLRQAMEKTIVPRPNTRLFGMPYKVWFFNAFSQSGPDSVRRVSGWFKQLTEPPVLLSSAHPQATSNRIHRQLFDNGFFHAEVSSRITTDARRARVIYDVTSGARYTIGDVVYSTDTNTVGSVVRQLKATSLLKSGQYLSPQRLAAERERIDDSLKRRGYFFFRPDYLTFRLDTAKRPAKAAIQLHWKPRLPAAAATVWEIGDIQVIDNDTLTRDTLRYRPRLFRDAVLLQSGRPYNRDLHFRSIERLMASGSFQFVKFAFTPRTANGRHLLDTRIQIVPVKRNSIGLDVSANSKETNYVGTRLGLTYKRHNLFGGGEQLEFALAAGADIQFGGHQIAAGHTSLVSSATMTIPRILPDVAELNKQGPQLPKTVFNVGMGIVSRRQIFSLHLSEISASYVWRPSARIEHQLSPLEFRMMDLVNTAYGFDSVVQSNPYFRDVLSKQFGLGAAYSLRYLGWQDPARSLRGIAEFRIKSNGNLYNLLASGFRMPDQVGANQLLGMPVTQFIKLEGDLRSSLQLSTKSSLAGRLLIGAGFAYANSRFMPYFEQFFIGGSSSVRAFRVGTLGPGSYHTEEKVRLAAEYGDTKLEINGEWRYAATKLVKLAVFADAGNIWVRQGMPEKPGSDLRGLDIFTELAVGGGVGLRFDFSLFLLRFDLATPLRKPWLPAGERWVFRDFHPLNNKWRRDNLVLNVGIGYPF